MKVEQFVMAYKVEQDKLRAMLPPGFTSLRPVLRFNAEIRDDMDVYVELNTPVSKGETQGWLNIENWNKGFRFERSNNTVLFCSDFLRLKFVGIGVEGGCPAEHNNDGCYYPEDDGYNLVPSEEIAVKKEFCDGEFAFCFTDTDAHGESYGGRTLPASSTEPQCRYGRIETTTENAAAIPCEQMLGQYKVVFERGDRL